ncbi:MAG: sulfate ABC transporter permease subunit CysW [Holophaga sp.]
MPESRRATVGTSQARAPACLLALALAFMCLFLVLPLVTVFAEALHQGWRVYLSALRDPELWDAGRLTLGLTLGTVALNVGFGLAAAWLLGKFDFPGRRVLVVLIELPFTVSPVVAGLMLMLVFGAHGWAGPWLMQRGIQVAFAWPGLLLATSFVTFPFVVRELAPAFRAQGREQEEAARILGASGWQTFWRVSLPTAKWALVYGAILCGARAMGEFGAVSVVSGHIRRQTITLPLQVEALYNEYQYEAAFACASLLCLTALLAVGLKTWAGRRGPRSRWSFGIGP